MRNLPGLVAALALLLVSGCASEPPESTASSVDTGVIVGSPSSPHNRARIHTELAGAYLSRGSMAVALQELNTAIAADSNYAPAYNIFGLVYQQLHETKLAQDNFRHALQLAPNDPDINHNYGSFLCQTGHEKESIKYFMRAVGNPLYTRPWRSYTAAGECSLRENKLKQAEAFFKRALRLQPDYPLALLKMGQIRYREGRYGGARSYVSRFNDIVPPTAESLWLAIRVEHKLGNRLAAAKLASRLRHRYPDSDEAYALQRGDYE